MTIVREIPTVGSHSIRRRVLGRVLKWFLCISEILVFLIVSFLCTFYLLARYREVQNTREAAPHTGRFVQGGDVRVFVQEEGPTTGPAILLIHGTGAWSEIWRETMAALAKDGFRAIAMDVPPFGYSEKPGGPNSYSRQNQARRIIGVLDSLQIEHATLVGHSVGGRPAVEVALEWPDRVQFLVIVDPALGFSSRSAGHNPGFQQNDPAWVLRTLFAIRPLRNATVATIGTNPLLTKRLFDSFVSNTAAVTEARVHMLQQPSVVENSTNAAGDWLEYLFISQDTSLGSDFTNFTKLRMPVVIIWGSSDKVTPLWQGEELHRLIPNSQFAVINQVGHIPYLEDAAAFNRVLSKSLTEHFGSSSCCIRGFGTNRPEPRVISSRKYARR